MRASRLLPVLLAATLLGCNADPHDFDPNVETPATSFAETAERTLRESFGEQAREILDGEDLDVFSLGADGYAPVASNPGDEGEAYRGGLKAVLPTDATQPIRFSVGEDFSFEVLESSVRGAAEVIGPRGNALVYERPGGGASIWVANSQGIEEWLLISGTWQGAGDREVERLAGEWTVRGALLRQQGDDAVLIDEAGRGRVLVSAPAAYSARGTPVQTRLAVRGDRISLLARTDGGTLLIDPLWQTTGVVNPRENHTATLLGDGTVLIAGGRLATSTAQKVLYIPSTGQFRSFSNLVLQREFHTATMLRDGTVLIVGGREPNGGNVWRQTEQFNGAIINVARANMNYARVSHTATLLNDGRVLVAGGRGGYSSGTVYDRAETYNPANNTWTNTGRLDRMRQFHTATLLADGRVLVVGGTGETSSQNTAELFNPGNNTWTAVSGSLPSGRYGHTATLIGPNRVLIAGGRDGSTIRNDFFIATVSGNSVTYSTPVLLKQQRYNHTATLLPDGRVMFAGGLTTTSDPGGTTNAVEIWDPNTNQTVTNPSMSSSREGHTATILASGKVLIVAGKNSSNALLDTAELFEPANPSWTTGPVLSGPRSSFAAIRTSTNLVAVVGGMGASALSTSEVYDQASNTWIAGPSMTSPRLEVTVSELRDGTALVVGGRSAGTPVPSTAVDRSSGTSLVAAAPLATGRFAHTATVLQNGQLLVVGGLTSATSVTNTVELFDPTSGTWSPGAPLTIARGAHTATLLPSGKVLVAGGFLVSGVTSSTEIYDPLTDSWTPGPNLPGSRYRHRATPLPDGSVLVTGGFSTTTGVSSNAAYRFSEPTNAWSVAGTMAAARAAHSATLLQSGQVLIAGGVASSVTLSSAELYEPASNAWFPVPDMPAPRSSHGAVLMADGRVAIIGGLNSGASQVTTFFYSEGRDELSGYRPIVAPLSPATASRGTPLTFSGARFTGVAEGSSGDQASSPANYPVVVFERQDDGAISMVAPSSWTASQLTISLPDELLSGGYFIRVVVNGVSSEPIFVRVQGAPLGTPCTAAASCESGFCVDGVCCENDCSGGCGACKRSARGNTGPADGYCATKPANAVCRAAADVCDEAEVCDGTSMFCPADAMKPINTSCVHTFNANCVGWCDGINATCQL